MVDFNSVQAKIDAVLTRTDLKNSLIEVQHYISTTNDYGEETLTFSSQEAVEGIILDYAKTRKKHDRAGVYNGSRFVVLLPSTCEISTDDKFLFRETTFKIEGIDEVRPNDILVLTKVFVSEE